MSDCVIACVPIEHAQCAGLTFVVQSSSKNGSKDYRDVVVKTVE